MTPAGRPRQTPRTQMTKVTVHEKSRRPWLFDIDISLVLEVVIINDYLQETTIGDDPLRS